MVVGQKCAQYISPNFGRAIFLIFAFVAFIVFAFYEQTKILRVMSVIGGFLMICNLSGIVKLRKDLKF
jgi:AGCS family alanine or glycine:cation symporter